MVRKSRSPDKLTSRAWFLGPKGENADVLEQLIVNCLRDHAYWRRNFHPEDPPVIHGSERRDPAFQASLDVFDKEANKMLSELKRGVPLFSPRYVGHMLSDTLMPAIVGYFAAMLYNPNNVVADVSPVTARYESEVARDLGRLIGYVPDSSWGHITSGGTIANYEAIWVARSIKYYPLAVRGACKKHGRSVHVNLSGRGSVPLEDVEDGALWELLNLPIDEVLDLRRRYIESLVSSEAGSRSQEKPYAAYEAQADGEIKSNEMSIAYSGWSMLSKIGTVPPVIFVGRPRHYSLEKAMDILGLGRVNLESIDVDDEFHMKLDELKRKLDESLEPRRHRPVLMVIANIGTTEEGAVDPLHELVEIRGSYLKRGLSFILHADAAYGGYARSIFIDSEAGFVAQDSVTEWMGPGDSKWPSRSVYEAFESLGSADSVTIDPHKLGYVPYPAGSITFKDARVKHLIAYDPPYLARDIDERGDKESGHGTEPFIGRYIMEGSKPGAAAAAVYLAHRVVPLNRSGYGLILREAIGATQDLYRSLGTLDKPKPYRAERGAFLVSCLSTPELNLINFIITLEGNPSLHNANFIMSQVYKRLRLEEASPIAIHRFFISRTHLTPNTYGNTYDAIMAKLGLRDVGYEKKLAVLRLTLMHPWLRSTHHVHDGKRHDYAHFFVEDFESILKDIARKYLIDYAKASHEDLLIGYRAGFSEAHEVFFTEFIAPHGNLVKAKLLRGSSIIDTQEWTEDEIVKLMLWYLSMHVARSSARLVPSALDTDVLGMIDEELEETLKTARHAVESDGGRRFRIIDHVQGMIRKFYEE